MKIALLSTNPRTYTTTRLKAAAESRGHKLRVLDTLDFSLGLEHGHPDLWYRGRPVERFDAVLPRIAAAVTYYGTAVLRQFEQMDVYSPNTARGVLNSRDKLRALQILSKHDIGIPETAFVRRKEDVLPAIARVGGAPVIIKLLEGTQGVGVILAHTPEIAEAIIQTLNATRQNVLIQKFVSESRGRDIRAFVIGDRVVASVRRVAQGQEFRSNVHLGGKAEAVELDERYRKTAVRAAQILGLKVAGVDILEAADGPQVMEVNSSPGLEGIEQATQLDIAGAVIDYMVDQVQFPEIDLRQRLTVSPGYGVAEVLITEKSPLDGVSIAQSGLHDLGVHVLTLHRTGDDVQPNPDSQLVIRSGDRLLCFGKLSSMKGLIPEKKTKRRARKIRSLPNVGAGDAPSEVMVEQVVDSEHSAADTSTS
ncbi:MAG: RimK family alpha-L-glutamate ligase [Planctomycetes bacterium]|nr:RimK family alpha-L-glutamate ligase [Planctomycetota bacterium]